MENVLILRYGELHLKGKNRHYFEKKLKDNIIHSIGEIPCKVNTISGRYIVSAYGLDDEDKLINKITKVFGLVSLSKCTQIDTSQEDIKEFASSLKITKPTFRVSVIRADKKFPIKSCDYEPIIGGYILDNNPGLKVKLKNYDLEVIVDIRENGKTYITFEKIPCSGGMPTGTAGKSLLLLSGGIDSPVAGHMIAKRGVELYGLHFHSYPYTSELAKNKVITLAKSLKEYTGKFRLYVVSFTKIQEEIHKHCRPEYMITVMRRIMMRIAERICLKNHIASIITGENLGQVASQTMEGLISTSAVVSANLPIFRPLIGFDKVEIMDRANKIGTYETSILPYEDCCTVFLPKNPLIKPKLELVEKEENKLDIDALVDYALENMEIIDC